MQAQDIINSALRELNIIQPGESYDAVSMAYFLIVLNALLGSWDLERLNIYAVNRHLWTMTSGVSTYTIGDGGTFDGTRPNSIRAAMVLLASGRQLPVRLVSAEEWAQLREPTAQGIPRRLYNDGDYPLSTLSVHPVPNGTFSLILLTWQPLTSFGTLTDDFDLPPGYERAIRLNLAVEIAPQLGRPLDPTLQANALQAKEALRGLNAPPVAGAAQEIQASGAAMPIPAPQNLADPR